MKLSTLLIGSAAFVAAFGALEAEASGTPGLRGCPIVPIKVICPPGTIKAMDQNAFNNCPPQFRGCFRKNKYPFRHDEMDDEEVGDDFGRPAHTRPQRPTGESIMNSIMWDHTDDEEVGWGDDFGRPAHTRPQQPTGKSIMNSIMWDHTDDEEVGMKSHGNCQRCRAYNGYSSACNKFC